MTSLDDAKFIRAVCIHCLEDSSKHYNLSPSRLGHLRHNMMPITTKLLSVHCLDERSIHITSQPGQLSLLPSVAVSTQVLQEGAAAPAQDCIS